MGANRRLLYLLNSVLCGSMMSVTVAGTLQLASACGGSGFSGTYTANSTVVGFEACSTPQGVRARFYKTDGAPLSEVRDESGSLTMYIAGIVYDQNMTDAQRTSMIAAASTPEAAIAVEVWGALADMGFLVTNPKMEGLAGAAMLFDSGQGYPINPFPSVNAKNPCTDPRNDCFGCCGYSCKGCTGICTVQCESHDACVRDNGLAAAGCEMAARQALSSLRDCENSNCTQ